MAVFHSRTPLVDIQSILRLAEISLKAKLMSMYLFIYLYLYLIACIQRADNVGIKTKAIEPITASALRKRLETEPLFVIDVREPKRSEKDKMKKAKAIPLTSLRAAMQNAPRNQSYCIVGEDRQSSLSAVETMADMGFERLTYIEGGYAAWSLGGIESD